jgi:hypothetical protein
MSEPSPPIFVQLVRPGLGSEVHHSEARGSAPRVPESLIGAALDLVARWEAGITPA